MRTHLETRFREQSSRSPIRTWAVEVHPHGAPEAFLDTLAGQDGRLEAVAGDASLHRLHFTRDQGQVTFFVDHLDERFWSFHTWNNSAEARPILRDLITSRRDIDWAWLPVDHMGRLLRTGRPRGARTDFSSDRFFPEEQPARRLRLRIDGTDVEHLLSSVRENPQWAKAVALDHVGVFVEDPNFGFCHEAVNREGCFVASGDSFGPHQVVVRSTIQRYRELVEAIEARMLRWSGDSERGGHVEGKAIALELSEPIPDLPLFLESLLSSREPFRLWGVPTNGPWGDWAIEAVDLHVGQCLRIEASDRWIRLVLDHGCCGNTVARLVVNLQHHVDANVRFEDPELQEILSPSGS